MEVLDYRDLVIETLADGEATLIDWIVDLTVERDAYRRLAQRAICHCHARYVEASRLRADLERLTSEYRALREQTMARDLETV